MPETSIIIRTFNEAKHLPSLFAALETQTYRDFESVVVDSGSNDPTREIARQQADKLVQIPQHDFTFGHSLNVGIQNSSGRFLAIISGHAIPTDTEWLGRLIEPLRLDRTAMSSGRQVGDHRNKLGEFVDFYRSFGTEKKVLSVPDQLISAPHFFTNNANSAVRRDLWERHPFDETLPGFEDVEWAKFFLGAGYDVVYEPNSCVLHIHEESWGHVRRRYYREALAAKWIGVRGRRDLPAETAREMIRLLGDFRWAVEHRRLSRPLDILRFRYERLLGTCAGIWDGAMIQNPAQRQQLFFDETYKAVVVRAPGKAALEDVQMPALKPGEVLVRVAYTGICATDIEVFEGSLGYYKDGVAKYPIVLGHEFSGVVAASGTSVADMPDGSRVVVECIQGCGYCGPCQGGRSIGCAERREVGVIGKDGGYAQFVIAPRKFLHRLPAEVSLRQAALCEPLAIVLKGLRRLGAALESSAGLTECGIIGAGPIGHLAARVLCARGHKVKVYDRSPERLRWFKGGSIQTSQELDDLSCFQILIEATGDIDALDAVLQKSAAGATILLVGLPYSRREFNFESIVGYDRAVVGSVGSAAEDFKKAIEILPTLDLSAFDGPAFPLADFELAWQAFREQKFLKTMLWVDADELESEPGRVKRNEAVGRASPPRIRA